MADNFYGLVYVSKSSLRFSQCDLTDLLAQSREGNLAADLTGLLLYANGNFMQLLEGDQKRIDELMVRIKRDSRHNDVNILEEGPVAQRSFPDWSMAFLDFHSPQVRAIPGYSTFLEGPFATEEISRSPSPNLKLLQFFRSVMAASKPPVLRLAQTIEPR
jgi:hypothetical protein